MQKPRLLDFISPASSNADMSETQVENETLLPAEESADIQPKDNIQPEETPEQNENIWESDRKDFVPEKQRLVFDEESGKLLISSAKNKVIVDSFPGKRNEATEKTTDIFEEDLIVNDMKNGTNRKYHLLSRTNEERFIITKYLSNINPDTVEDLRQLHESVKEDFMAYIEEDSIQAFGNNFCLEVKAIDKGTAFLFVAVIKEKLNEPSIFRKLPVKIEIEQ